LAQSDEIRCGLVEYKLIKALDEDEDAAGLRDFPFFKREGFADEKEWRAIHVQKKSKGVVVPKAQYVTIPHDCIARIVINPWMATPLYTAVKGVLSSIDGCGKVPIIQSRLTNSSQWKEAADRLVGRYL